MLWSSGKFAQSRFADRTCDLVGDSCWSGLFLKESTCGGTHTGVVCEELQPMGKLHIGEIHRGLPPVGWIPHWSRSRVILQEENITIKLLQFHTAHLTEVKSENYLCERICIPRIAPPHTPSHQQPLPLLSRIVPTQVKHLAPGLVELHEVFMVPLQVNAAESESHVPALHSPYCPFSPLHPQLEAMPSARSKLSATALLFQAGIPESAQIVSIPLQGVCYRPPSHDEDADELFFKELRDTSKSTALVLVGDFNLPEINWQHHTADTTWARKFPKNVDDNLMEQVLRGQTSKDALLDLLLVNTADPMSKVETGGLLATVNTKSLSLKSLLTGGKCEQNLNSGHEESRVQATQGIRDVSALSWRTMTARMIRSQLTLKLRGIFCSRLDPYRAYTGPDGINPRILNELADVVLKPLMMIFEWSLESREVTGDWKLVIVVLIIKKGTKEDPEIYRPVSLTSVPSRVLEKTILQRIVKHLKDKAVIGWS
ncbi:hypothetical protein WISP_62321 [Willisornis vidua]|uniref:Endonuclease/exonuclease/phosphatase domain-containing protein n=1 Tax=Willisornis vidua TaxID=1566151 RepID=A0ABQ9DA60_9PASS|nr:hypothetical protein WISP_62321 [Willisornis vidua]